MNNIHTYELSYLALEHLSPSDVESMQTTVADMVSKLGGQVLSTGDVHYIELAYEMVKKIGSKNIRHSHAYFSWVKYTMDASAISDLDAAMFQHADVLRHMIIQTHTNNELTDVFTLQQDEAADTSSTPSDTAPVDDGVIMGEEIIEPATADTDSPMASPTAVSSDDLTKIEGIGPVIATTLTNAGIATYSQLADTAMDTIVESITGVRGKHDPATWSSQAALARDGAWAELAEMQETLKSAK